MDQNPFATAGASDVCNGATGVSLTLDASNYFGGLKLIQHLAPPYSCCFGALVSTRALPFSMTAMSSMRTPPQPGR